MHASRRGRPLAIQPLGHQAVVLLVIAAVAEEDDVAEAALPEASRREIRSP
jgi:hypothetical protein